MLERLAGDRALVEIGVAAQTLAQTELSPARFIERLEALLAENQRQ